jgi:two-component system, cell cycle response regulator
VGEHDLYETTVEVTITRDFTRSLRRVASWQAYLVVIAGPKLGHRAVLDERPLEIGRGTQCGLQLDADSVSRQHARVEWTGSSHKAVDLGSTNGTFVNEARIGERELSDGDRLQIGKVLLKYISGSNVENAYHEEVQRLMRFDGLTGIHNRSHFEETFHNLLWRARLQPSAVSLILFDLDHFKAINDTHGHTAGDAVLRQVTEIVGAQVPEGHLFARVGGEEFAVLLAGWSAAHAYPVAEAIRRAVETNTFTFEGTHIPVTLSLGIAEWHPTDQTPHQLYERADGQLYAAKGAGRNCVR